MVRYLSFAMAASMLLFVIHALDDKVSDWLWRKRMQRMVEEELDLYYDEESG